jgi:hypothetical protein
MMKQMLDLLEANILRGEKISSATPLQSVSDALLEAAHDLDAQSWSITEGEKRRLAMLCMTLAARYWRKLGPNE